MNSRYIRVVTKPCKHETRNWNNFDKCEPEQQCRLGTVSYKITGGLKPVLQVPNLTLSFCSGSQHLVSSKVLHTKKTFRDEMFLEISVRENVNP